MSPDEAALLAAAAANPADDLPRLVYADWLDEHDQPHRAEFVRLQCELAALPPHDPMRPFMVWRHKYFLTEFVPVWRRELPVWPGISWGDFSRGLAEEVHADTAEGLARHATEVFAAGPVSVVRLARLTGAARLAARPELTRARRLRLINTRPTTANLRALLASPHLTNLTAIELDANGFGDDGVRLLAEEAAVRMPELVELWLGANGITDAGAEVLAGCPHLGKLRDLDLRGNNVTGPAVRGRLARRFGAGLRL